MAAPGIEHIQSSLSGHQVQAFLVTNPLSLRYLTGFTGDVGMLLVAGEGALLAVDPRYTEQAGKETTGARVTEVRDGWGDWLTGTLASRKIARLAVEAEHVTLSQWEEWHQHLPEVELKPVKGTVADLRIVKSQEEIRSIEAAVALTDEAFAAFRCWLRPGATELEAAWFIEAYMRTHGAEAVAFDVVVAAGPNSAMPHARPGVRCISEQEPIVVDIGSRIAGYNSDLTRTLWIGPSQDRFARLYSVVQQAQEAAEAAIRATMAGKEADAVARRILTDAGYGDAFGHGLGHGVGLEVHEAPHLSPRSTDTLEPGHVVTIEPGVYLPGWGGIRIEDMVVVTDDGIRILTGSTKEPWVSSSVGEDRG